MTTRTLSIKDGVLCGAKFVPSPNFNDRPQNTTISGIVIHNISLPPHHVGQKDKHGEHFVSAFFQNKLNADDHPYFATIADLQVSAHLFIEKDGTITQFVNFNDRAWHAGQSSYLGRSACNDFTIGIELEGDDVSVFSDEQYEVLCRVIVAIYQAYPATHRHLMGHSDIAPTRKTDPGAFFDWQRVRQTVQHLLDDASSVR